MVQTDVSQLSGECQNWREMLRNNRQELTDLRQNLQQIASQPLSKDELYSLEHYQNQFHIQLINVHDLKQAIKRHERQLTYLKSDNDQELEVATTTHEDLYEQYIRLESTLQELRSQFGDFMERSN